jgi:hypothetical protein
MAIRNNPPQIPFFRHAAAFTLKQGFQVVSIGFPRSGVECADRRRQGGPALA